VARLETTRRIAADPTSAALLLAGPSAVELWPGATLERTGPDDQLRVMTELPAAFLPVSGRAAVLVRALSPQRTPTAFLLRFSFGAAGFPGVRGELALEYAVPGASDASDEPRPATDALLRLDVDDPAGADLVVPLDRFLSGLQTLAETFLDNLAIAAEGRSQAA
jgi:hypothetical protein